MNIEFHSNNQYLLLGRDLSDDRVDHTHSHCHLHVAHGESSKRRVGLEGLANHGAHWAHDNIRRIAGLDDLGVLLNDLVGTPVDLVLDCLKLASNVACVAVENWSIAVLDVLVVHHNHLGLEGLSVCARVVLCIRRNVSAANILDRDVLHVESNVIAWASLWERLVVHLDGLDFSGDTSGSKGDHHAWLDDASLDSANRHCADTADLVHVLERKTESKIVRALWLAHEVERLEQNGALVPRHLVGSVDHVIADPARDGNKADWVLLVVDLVADLLKEAGALLLDLLETGLVIENSVHLVDSNDHLLNSEGVGEQGVLAGLADHCAGAAATTTLASGKIAVTVDLHINYLAPANGEKISATAQCVQTGSTLCVVSVSVTSTRAGEAKVCAIATVTLRVVDMPRMA